MPENMPTSLNCPACGAPLEYDGLNPTIRCKFCGNISIMPASLQNKTATVSSAALDEVRRLAAGGNLVEAIKKYRQIYNVGLAQAKEAVEALQAGRMVTPSAAGARSPEELTHTLEEVQQLLAQGKKIEAVKVYREHFDVGLERAKYAVDQIEAGQTAFPEAGFTAAMSKQAVQEQMQSRSKKGSKAGCAAAILGVLVVIFGIGAMILFLPGGPLSQRAFVNGAVTEVNSASAQPDFAALLYNPDKDIRYIGLVNGASGKLTWRSASLSGDGFADAIVPGTDLVYVANGNELLAYKKSDGSNAWQTQMPDSLNSSDSSILFTGSVLITTTQDQSVQAFNANTGAQVWSRRLIGYDRVLRLFGASLVLVESDESYNYSLLFLDAATGSEQAKITPSCSYNDYDFTPLKPDSGLVYDPTANALYLIMDYSYSCVQRYDLYTGSLVWSTASDTSLTFNPEGMKALQIDAAVYFDAYNGLYRLDKASGSLGVLLANEDYDFLPMAVSGSDLLVRARRSRGSESFEIWMVDASTGARKWQVNLQGAKPIDPPNEMAGLIDKNDTGFTWTLQPEGLKVLTFEGQPHQVSVETYDLSNGNSLGQQVLPLKTLSGDFYEIPQVIGWHGATAYMVIDTNIYSLDLGAGKVRKIY